MAGMDVRKRVGLNLRRLRQAKGLTQEELAHRAEIHQTYLSGVEVGKRNPSIEVLDRIAAALGADISALFVEPQRLRRATR
jgi:transcriptional regulator with XRE-family HTH domain